MIKRRVWGTLMPLMVGMGPGWECWAKESQTKAELIADAERQLDPMRMWDGVKPLLPVIETSEPPQFTSYAEYEFDYPSPTDSEPEPEPEPEPDEKTKAFQVTLEKLAGA